MSSSATRTRYTQDQVEEARGLLLANLDDFLPPGHMVGEERHSVNPLRSSDKHDGSFSVNVRTGAWHDFADDGLHPAGGNIWKLFSEVTGVSGFRGALDEAFRRYGNGRTARPEREARRQWKPKEVWTPIVPVPADAPPPPRAREDLGTPDDIFIYRGLAEETLLYIYRWDAKPGQRKQMRPLCYAEGPGGKRAWRWQGLPAPRPLYGLELLGTAPSAEIVVLEGERKTNVMRNFIKEAGAPYIAMSIQGGADGVEHMDFTPLAGQAVSMFPDKNEVGMVCMQKAAHALTDLGCKVKWIDPPAETPDGGDVADLNALGWSPAQIMDLIVNAKPWKQESSPDEAFFFTPNHGLAADILFEAFGKEWIFERHDATGRGEFFARTGCYYTQILDAKYRAREVLEKKITVLFDRLKASTSSSEVRKIFEAAGRALQKVRTRDFLASTIALLAERVSTTAIPWNVTPEAHPTLTGVVDFSGESPAIRDVRAGEFFRDAIPLRAEDILSARSCRNFQQYMTTLFPDEKTRLSAMHCLALCIANKGTKKFQIWHNAEGNGAKNTTMDLMMRILPNRMRVLKGALILCKGDKSERRFGEIELRRITAGFFDEVDGAFAISQIKRYQSLSTIRGEAKGRDSVEFPQTWELIALCNGLPDFSPATDPAFLSRLFVLPFASIFYATDDERERHVARGVDPSRLHPAKDKAKLMDELMAEHPAILNTLITAYIDMRRNHGGQPYESPACKKAREVYRKDNDLAEQLFDDCLLREEAGKISYSDLLALYISFTGDRKMTTRELSQLIIDRFPFAVRDRAHGVRYIKGISAKPDSLAEAKKESESHEFGF